MGSAQAQNGTSDREWSNPFDPRPPTLTEGQKRRILRPHVVLASDCIARNVLLQPNVMEAYRALNLLPVIAAAWPLCGRELGQVLSEHDRLHGPGTGAAFLKGPYTDDLPRAVTTQIKGEMERRIIALDSAEAERKAELARAEARKREDVARAENAATAARDRLYTCTDLELLKLVSAAETADNLTTAAMTLCRREVTEAVDARADALQVNAEGSLSDSYLRSFREELRRSVRDSVLTSAVQAKALANTPTPAAPRASTPPPVPASAQPVPAAASPAAAPVAPPPVSIARGIGAALEKCLTVTNTVQHGQMVNREGLIRAMLDLCRPEIEAEARTAYLADGSMPLDERREAVLTQAMKSAADIADGRTAQP